MRHPACNGRVEGVGGDGCLRKPCMEGSVHGSAQWVRVPRLRFLPAGRVLRLDPYGAGCLSRQPVLPKLGDR